MTGEEGVELGEGEGEGDGEGPSMLADLVMGPETETDRTEGGGSGAAVVGGACWKGGRL